MATISSDSYSISPSYVKYSKYLYNNKKTKTTNRKPIFAPILEEPSNIVQNLQELNTSSIPITNNNNNNSSFENSINGTYMVDYHTMNKFRPSLNLSCLPPVFEIPRKQVNDINNNNNNLNNMLLANNKSIYNDKNNNTNNKILMRNSRLNLRPIVNNNVNANSNINAFNNTAGGVNNNIGNNKSNFVALPPINSHTNYNNINNNNLNKINNNINYNSNKNNKNSNNSTYNIRNYNQRKRQYLKPIQYKNSPNPSSYNSYGNNNNDTKRTIDAEKQGGSYGKNQGKYYYNLNNRNIIKSEKLKEERVLRHKEMSNISINQNKNYVDKNIVIKYNTKINNTLTTNNMNSINNISTEEYIEIDRNKSRVIHIPTLKIYNRFDVPIKNWNLYEKYVKNWTKMMRGVLEIKAVIENNETNCYNVIIERSKNCSLGDLLRSIGSVNEYIIMTIVKQILPLIQKYNGIFDYREKDINEQIFNFIDIDNIWFNEQYNIVLYPGKFRFNNKNECLNNFLRKIFEKKNDSINNQINIDLMNFGITLINMNIFILDISVEDLFKLIKKEEEDINDICCLFHYFSKKINFFSNFFESFKSNISNSDFNENYFDFLHVLTLFERPEKKNVIENILNHPFIINSSVVNENTNINELIKVSKTYDFSNEYYTSNANIISFDLITRNIRKKLPNFESFFSLHNIYDTKTLLSLYNIEIEELCRELRVNEEELHDKLLIYYENMLENKENHY